MQFIKVFKVKVTQTATDKSTTFFIRGKEGREINRSVAYRSHVEASVRQL